MKKLLSLLAVAAVVASAGTASAADGPAFGFAGLLGRHQLVSQTELPPIPEGQSHLPPSVPPAPGVVGPPPMMDGQMIPSEPYDLGHGAPVELFHRVKYKDLREMAPCAVPKIVYVNDPCACNDPCNCCGPKCVAIQICVPPCACEDVRVRRNGDRVRYCYGEYAVDVRVKKGYIEVDYQD